jgi:hypothetical protein
MEGEETTAGCCQNWTGKSVTTVTFQLWISSPIVFPAFTIAPGYTIHRGSVIRPVLSSVPAHARPDPALVILRNAFFAFRRTYAVWLFRAKCIGPSLRSG